MTRREAWRFCYLGVYLAPLNWQLVFRRGQVAIGPLWLDWMGPLERHPVPTES